MQLEPDFTGSGENSRGDGDLRVPFGRGYSKRAPGATGASGGHTIWAGKTAVEKDDEFALERGEGNILGFAAGEENPMVSRRIWLCWLALRADAGDVTGWAAADSSLLRRRGVGSKKTSRLAAISLAPGAPG
jgi:hypothetical protein